MYNDLKGKVAVVTGGSKGIGNAIARRLSEEKMKVVIPMRVTARIIFTLRNAKVMPTARASMLVAIASTSIVLKPKEESCSPSSTMEPMHKHSWVSMVPVSKWQW